MSSENNSSSPLTPVGRPGPPGGKRDLNRRKRIQDLLSGALTCFLERGIEVVTIDDIARSAGIAKGSFYRYFRSKRDLVALIFAPLAQKLEEAMTRCEKSLEEAKAPHHLFIAYGMIGLNIADLVKQYPQRIRLYLQSSRGPLKGDLEPISEISQHLYRSAIEMTLAARSHDLLRSDINAKVSAIAVMGAIEQLLFNHLSGKLGLEASQVTQELISLMLKGLGTSP